MPEAACHLLGICPCHAATGLAALALAWGLWPVNRIWGVRRDDP